MKNAQMDDDFFAAHEKVVKENAEARKAGKTTSQTQFESIQWCGLEKDNYKAIRFLGAPPTANLTGYKRKPTDSLHIYVADILDDEGKRRKLRLPMHSEVRDKDFILHKMISKITEKEWVKVPGQTEKKRVFKWENDPTKKDLWDWVDKGGFTAANSGKSAQYQKGLPGTLVCIVNVIDRSDDWCAKNNHTKILSKSADWDEEKQEFVFPFTGIGAYGFSLAVDASNQGIIPELDKLLAHKQAAKYKGNWEKFDIGITKTGTLSPYKLVNLSAMKEGGDILMDTLDQADFDWNSVSCAPLTEAELNYDRYDIDKAFAVTTYNKLLKLIPNRFKAFDAAFGTHYYEELVYLADKEKETWEKNSDSDSATTSNESYTTKEASAIKEAMADQVTDTSSIKGIELMPYFNKLAPQEQAVIRGAHLTGSGKVEIDFSDEADSCLECDNVINEDTGETCGVAVPTSFGSCPCCGCQYEA